jgi:hypothetical protein
MLTRYNSRVNVQVTNLNCTVLPARLQLQDPQRLRHHHAFFPVVRWRNTLKELQSLKGGGTTRRLVWSHTTDGSEEDLGGCTVMEGARLFRVDNVPFVQEIVVAQLKERRGSSHC